MEYTQEQIDKYRELRIRIILGKIALKDLFVMEERLGPLARRSSYNGYDHPLDFVEEAIYQIEKVASIFPEFLQNK